MKATDYQKQVLRTTSYTDSSRKSRLAHWSMGLAGEAGEVIDHLKKHLYHGHSLDKEHVMEELGDVCWYLATLAAELDIDFDSVLAANLRKLAARYPEGFSEKASIERKDQDPS